MLIAVEMGSPAVILIELPEILTVPVSTSAKNTSFWFFLITNCPVFIQLAFIPTVLRILEINVPFTSNPYHVGFGSVPFAVTVTPTSEIIMPNDTHLFKTQELYDAKDKDNVILGTICVFVEVKFIHGLSRIGHIEDYVVEEKRRRNKIGTRLMEIAKKYCQDQKCYKIILDCDDSYIPFYEKFGFKKKANSMQLYYI